MEIRVSGIKLIVAEVPAEEGLLVCVRSYQLALAPRTCGQCAGLGTASSP
jgi:hypothetical protein